MPTPDPRPLTKRQEEVYRSILKHYAVHGTPPTMRDIMAAMDLKSTNAVVNHLRPMAKKGAIVLAGKLARGVTVPALAERVKSAAAELLGAA